MGAALSVSTAEANSLWYGYPEAIWIQNTAAGLSDASSDLEELESQSAYLSSGKLRSLEGLSEQPEERVGSRVEKQTKLVGQEAVAAQPIGLDFPFEFFDPVLYIASKHVDPIIDPLGIDTKLHS